MKSENPMDDDATRDADTIPEPDLSFIFPLPDLRYDRRGRNRGRGKGEPGEEPIYTPYIVLNHTDPAIPGSVFYLSPDIWVESSLGTNLPVEGEANTIFARVHNRGLMDATNVNVRFFWADPSAAITDQTVIPIGGNLAAATRTGVNIPAAVSPGADSSVVVECPVPWFPAPITHECLLVKAWSPGYDPNTAPFEPVLDPVTDRHSAQHNVTVKRVAAGQNLKLSVNVANISGFKMEMRVAVRALTFEQVGRQLEILQVPLKHELIESYMGVSLEAWLSEDKRYLRQGHGAFGRLLLASEREAEAAKAEDKADRQEPVVELSEWLNPWERRQLILDGYIPSSARPGEAFGFDISEYLGGIKTGGYVAVFVVGE